MVEDMHLKYAKDIHEALAMAHNIMKKKGVTEPKVTVIPDGVFVIVK